MPYEEEADAGDEQPGKIRVVCHGCGARYQVRDSKVRGRRFRATCKRCGGMIVARCTNASTLTPERSADLSLSAHSLPGEEAQQEAASWYVVMGGKPHGPLSPLEVRKYFTVRRINLRTYLWQAGESAWRRLGEVAEFEDLVMDGPGSRGDTEPPDFDERGEDLDEPGEGFDEEQPTDVGSDQEGTQETTISPRALRREEHDYDDDSGSYEPSSEEARATQLRAVSAERPGAKKGLAQPSFPPLPQVPRRKAALPMPTGVPRRPELVTGGRQGEVGTVPYPAPAPLQWPGPVQAAPWSPPAPPAVSPVPSVAPAPLLTPSLSPGAGLKGLPLLVPPPADPFTPAEERPPNLAPPVAESFVLTPGPGVPLASAPVGAGATRPVPRRPHFWTTAKIAAAAAIAGGLAVAGTVVLVVALVRARNRPPLRARRPLVQQPLDIKVKPAAPTSGPATAPPATKTALKAATSETKAWPEEARPEAAPLEPEQTPRFKPTRPPPAKQPARRGKKGKSGGGEMAEADALLAEASGPKKTAGKKGKKASGGASVDVDDLLTAAGGADKKKSPGADEGAKGTLTAQPSPAQLRQSMRAVWPQVRACYEKFQQQGKIEVMVTLRGDGSHDQQVVGAFAGTPTAACVVQAVSRARLPRFSGAATSFWWPYVFR